MYQFILLIHIFAAICIVALVLVQQGKGATVGAAFGSGASQTVFGSRGSGSFLFRLTATFAAVFFVTSIGLNYMVSRAYRQQAVVTLPNAPAQKAPMTSTPSLPAIPAPAPATSDDSVVTKPILDMPATPADIPVKK